MYLVREIMYCKPGKVRPMIEKYVKMSQLMEKAGMGKMSVMTDVAAERYWTIIAQYELENLDKLMSMEGMDEQTGKEMEELMKDYHDFIDHGKREVYKIET